MALKEKINADFMSAFKNKETDKKNFLGVVKGEIQNEEGRSGEMTDEGVMNILRKMEKEQTLGQKRVKADFNPAKNDLVDQIKNKAAELIDLCEEMRNLPLTGTGEKQRLISLAQTEIETACMYAVKANFTE